MNGPIKNEREELGNRLKWLERRLIVSGSVVVVGVFVEISSKVLKRQIDNEVIGGVLIMVGVAGEVAIALLTSLKTDRIREIADSEIAQANERAANAENEAAKNRLKAAELESSIGRPRLTGKFREALENVPPGKIEIWHFADKKESAVLARDIASVFGSLRWAVSHPRPVPPFDERLRLGARCVDDRLLGTMFSLIVPQHEASNPSENTLLRTFWKALPGITGIPQGTSGITTTNELADSDLHILFVGEK
ncbi:MAG TPA: hypothetical protein VIY49_06280 [Bryobacteraceae bacterium]